MRDHVIGIDDLDVVLLLDVARGDHTLTGLLEGERRVVAAVHLQHDAFEVQENVYDILLNSVYCRIFVEHARHFHFGGGVTRHRREQRAAERIAQGVAVSALERLHREPGVEGRDVLHIDDAGFQEGAAGHGFDTSRL